MSDQSPLHYFTVDGNGIPHGRTNSKTFDEALESAKNLATRTDQPVRILSVTASVVAVVKPMEREFVVHRLVDGQESPA